MMRIQVLALLLLACVGAALGQLAESDVDTLAKTLYGEANGEKVLGQIAVAYVIRNRALNTSNMGRWWRSGARTSRHKSAIYNVCHRQWQFSWYVLAISKLTVALSQRAKTRGRRTVIVCRRRSHTLNAYLLYSSALHQCWPASSSLNKRCQRQRRTHTHPPDTHTHTHTRSHTHSHLHLVQLERRIFGVP
jgi:hypothetical protein